MNKKKLLGKITDIFFDVCLFLGLIICIFAIFINKTTIVGILLYACLLICLLSAIYGIFISTRKIDKYYFEILVNSPDSVNLLTISDKILPFSNSSLLRTKLIRWSVYLRKPKTIYTGNIELKNKLLKNIDCHLNIIDKVNYRIFAFFAFLSIIMLVINFFR